MEKLESSIILRPKLLQMASSHSNGRHGSAIFFWVTRAYIHQGRSGSWIEGWKRSFEMGFSLLNRSWFRELFQQIWDKNSIKWLQAIEKGAISSHFLGIERWLLLFNGSQSFVGLFWWGFHLGLAIYYGLFGISTVIVSTDVLSSVHMSYCQYTCLIVRTRMYYRK